jgi:monoamine oxidase
VQVWFDGTGPFYATAFYTSDQARRVAAMDTAAAFDALLAQLSEMFRCSAESSYQGGFMMDWGAVPHIWAGYTTPALRELPHARRDLATPLHGGRVCFAGEATDPTAFMTAHAAMRTGYRAAAEAAAAAGFAPKARL